MTISWENAAYEKANNYMQSSETQWREGSKFESLKFSFSARAFYLADVIINTVRLPFALLETLFAVLHSCVKWNWKSEYLHGSYTFLLERSNHFFLSAFGILLPGISHTYRDANLTPYIVAARIIIISGAILYYSMR